MKKCDDMAHPQIQKEIDDLSKVAKDIVLKIEHAKSLLTTGDDNDVTNDYVKIVQSAMTGSRNCCERERTPSPY